jgi:hypothetical protein
MRQLLLISVVVLYGAVLGCNKGEQVTVKGPDNKELTVTGPGNTSITQGDTTKIKVSVSRKNFNDPVEITFDQLPEGVTIAEETKTIAKDADSTHFTLKADEKAKPVQNHAVKLSASGGGMKAGPIEFKLDVKEKEVKKEVKEKK